MTLQTRRQRREQQRRRGSPHRKGGPEQAGRRGWIAPAVAIGVLVAIVLGLRAAGVFEPASSVKLDLNDPRFNPSGLTIGTKQKDDGSAHAADGQKVAYNTNPPTSGAHWAAAAPWGSYDSQQPNERTVHNLEHGGIVVSYHELPNEEVARLKGIVAQLRSDKYRKILLQPYPSLSDAKVALAAWDWLLKLQSVDEAQIVQFVRAHYEGPDAPEPSAN